MPIYATLTPVGDRNYMVTDEAMLKEFERLNRKIDQLVDANSRLIDEISNQSSLIAQLTAEIAAKEELIVAKDELIAELQRKNGMNSGNSSMPPSSDRFTKPKPSKINKGGNKVKKRSGGQIGHKGSTMKLKDEPD